jgi:hypothetical protein
MKSADKANILNCVQQKAEGLFFGQTIDLLLRMD